jgi:hypothetical protein
MDLGTVFGLVGLLVALMSLVYVRTQAEASRLQAEATAEQTRIARRIAALEVSLRLADRTFDVRREMMAEPAVIEAYWRANPQLEETHARAGGIGAVMMIRRMLDSTQDIYLLRKEGIVTDAHWRNWIAALRPFMKMPEVRAILDNAVERQVFDDEYVAFLRAFDAPGAPPDPAPRQRPV